MHCTYIKLHCNAVNLIQNSLALKNVWPQRMLFEWNPKWCPRNSSDGRLIAKKFNDDYSGEFVLPSPRFIRIRHQIGLLSQPFLGRRLLSQPFLGRLLGFSITASLGMQTFLHLDFFGIDFTSFLYDLPWSRYTVVCRVDQEAGAPHPWVYWQEEQSDFCCGDALHCQYPTFQISNKLCQAFPRYEFSKKLA